MKTKLHTFPGDSPENGFCSSWSKIEFYTYVDNNNYQMTIQGLSITQQEFHFLSLNPSCLIDKMFSHKGHPKQS